MRKRLYLPTVFLTLALVLAGCTTKGQTPGSPGAQAGGTLVVGDSWSVVTLDPAMYNDQGSYDVITLIFDALVDHDENYKVIPRLATSWENPDNTTWIFHLRKDAKWQDGNEVFPEGQGPQVTAEDVKYTIERLLDPATKSSRIALVQSVDKVEAVDKYTVKITTKQPDAFFLDNLASVFIVNKKVVETLGPEKFARSPIGSGPFKLVELQPDDHTTVVRNEDHWTKPNLDKIIIKPIPDPNAMLVALESGDIQVAAQVPQKDVARLQQVSTLKVQKQTLAAYRYVAFNCAKEPTKDLKFREAISMAIDMDAAVNAIFPPGMAERAVGPVPPNILGYDPSLKQYWEYNPDKAKQLLSELGWTDTDGDKILEKGGKELTLKILAPQDTNRSKLSVIIATSLKDLGIKAEVQNLEWGTLLSEIDKGNFDMFILGGFSGPNGMIFLFHSRNKGPNGNNALYENPEVDRLLDLGSTLVKPEEREPVWKQAQELIVKDKPHIPAYHEYFFFGYSSKLHDYQGDMRFVSSKNNAWLEK